MLLLYANRPGLPKKLADVSRVERITVKQQESDKVTKRLESVSGEARPGP